MWSWGMPDQGPTLSSVRSVGVGPRADPFHHLYVPLGHIISKYGILFQCYADDTQLCVRLDPFSPTGTLTTAWRNEGVDEWQFSSAKQFKIWGSQNWNPTSTPVLPLTAISFAGHIFFTSYVSNLGVKSDHSQDP